MISHSRPGPLAIWLLVSTNMRTRQSEKSFNHPNALDYPPHVDTLDYPHVDPGDWKTHRKRGSQAATQLFGLVVSLGS